MSDRSIDLLYTLTSAALLKLANEGVYGDAGAPAPQEPQGPPADAAQQQEGAQINDQHKQVSTDTKNVYQDLKKVQALKPKLNQIRGILQQRQMTPQSPVQGDFPAPGMASPQGLTATGPGPVPVPNMHNA